MNEKFTPGPWEKEYSARRDEWEIYIDGDCIALASVYPNVPEYAANAALIAAAPELYEALKFAFPLFTHMPDCSQRITPDHACDCGYSEAISESGAALAKAQGE